MSQNEKLAIDGGTPVIQTPLPKGVSGPSIIGDEEINAVTDLLRRQQLFRFTEDSQTAAFEKEASEMLDVDYALMVNSGTRNKF